MQRYLDINDDSGVAAYEIGAAFIRVRFKDGSVYLYTNDATGVDNIQHMKQLAEAGDGLNSFISKRIGKER